MAWHSTRRTLIPPIWEKKPRVCRHVLPSQQCVKGPNNDRSTEIVRILTDSRGCVGQKTMQQLRRATWWKQRRDHQHFPLHVEVWPPTVGAGEIDREIGPQVSSSQRLPLGRLGLPSSHSLCNQGACASTKQLILTCAQRQVQQATTEKRTNRATRPSCTPPCPPPRLPRSPPFHRFLGRHHCKRLQRSCPVIRGTAGCFMHQLQRRATVRVQATNEPPS